MNHNIQFSEEIYNNALEFAQTLRMQLEIRLLGSPVGLSSCNCGAHRYGPSRVTDVHIPVRRNRIGMWSSWSSSLHDDQGKRRSAGLDEFISWHELYTMFRNAFSRVDIPVEHPDAELYRDNPINPTTDSATQKFRTFNASDRKVVVTDWNPVYVRPTGDLRESVWLCAELRVDSALPGYSDGGMMLAANVDPFECGQMIGRGAGRYFKLPHPGELPTFYVRIPGVQHDTFVPIARLVAYSRSRCEATFLLDQTVESFRPR